MSFAFSKVAPRLGALATDVDVTFDTVATDTRQLKPGDLFVALIGENFDGHRFVDSAQQKGACGAVVSKPVATSLPLLQVQDTLKALGDLGKLVRETFNGCMVALTGSSGKTTVKEMVYSILQEVGPTLATAKNYNNEVGVPLTLMQLNSSYSYAVLELGARKRGDIAYLRDLVSPDVVLVNNVMSAHIEGFGSLDNVALAKGEIYDNLLPQAKAILNSDEMYCDQWRHQIRAAEIITYSMNSSAKADFYAASVIELPNHHIAFELFSPLGEVTIQLNAIGQHNVSNALAAAAASYAAGADLAQIKIGLEKFCSVEGRLYLVEGIASSQVVDDSYNANPGSVRSAIDTIANWPGEKVLVLGDMAELGDEAERLHREIGGYSAGKIDSLISVGNLSEAASKRFGQKGLHFADHASLVDHCKSIATNKTIFLVKGSRSSMMEKVVQALTALEEQA